MKEASLRKSGLNVFSPMWKPEQNKGRGQGHHGNRGDTVEQRRGPGRGRTVDRGSLNHAVCVSECSCVGVGVPYVPLQSANL